MKKIHNININEIVNTRRTLQIDLYRVYFNNNTERIFDSLEEALFHCYNILASKSYAPPVAVVYETLTRMSFTCEYVNETIAVYDLMQDDIQIMLNICNNALARYYDMYSDDWSAWCDKCKQCQKRATAVIMQKLKKQVKA